MVQVVKRIAEILAVVDAAGTLPLRDIAVRTGLRKTTAGNLVRSLLAVGMLDQRRKGDYAIGRGLRRLAWEGPPVARLSALASAAVSRLAKRLQEGVVAARLTGHGLAVLAEATPDHDLVVSPRVLREVSPYAWATGRALLAAQPCRTPRALVSQYGPPDRDWPEAAGCGLEAELRRIREQAWAQRINTASGIHSIARAVLDPFGQGVFAVGVYVPQSRCGDQRLAEILRALGATVEALSAGMTALDPGAAPGDADAIPGPPP